MHGCISTGQLHMAVNMFGLLILPLHSGCNWIHTALDTHMRRAEHMV